MVSNADPDPVFYLDADPDLGNADKFGSWSDIAVTEDEFLHKEKKLKHVRYSIPP